MLTKYKLFNNYLVHLNYSLDFPFMNPNYFVFIINSLYIY